MIFLQQLQTGRETDRFWDLEVESGPDSGDPTEVSAHPLQPGNLSCCGWSYFEGPLFSEGPTYSIGFFSAGSQLTQGKARILKKSERHTFSIQS